MSACFVVVPCPPAMVAPVMLCLRRASPTATVPGLRPTGPRGDTRSVTQRMLSFGRWTRRYPSTWGLGML